MRRRTVREGTRMLPARAVAMALPASAQGTTWTPDRTSDGGAPEDQARAVQADVVQRVDGSWTWPDGHVVEWALEELDRPGRSRLTLWRTGARGTLGGQVIRLDRVPQPLGGVRWWLRCPMCDHRRGALYVLPGAATAPAFRCRVCLGLAYVTQQVPPMDRLYMRAQKLARRVGADNPMDRIDRPHGMHRATFERRLDELHDVLEERDRVWMEEGQRLLRRIGGGRQWG